MNRLPAASFVVFLLVLNASCGAYAAPQRLALLVGCSKYVADDIDPLPGAANDVEHFRQLLAENFGFADIETLVGWPDEGQRRPTCTNINTAMDRLVARAKAGSQAVILFSGHGSYFPVPDAQTDLLDPRNPEPDGFDEAFLAADYQIGENMILDNQVGLWLEQLKSKGVHVWIIFDSCFSGTMVRGGGEKPRQVAPHALGIRPESLAAAQRRAIPAERAVRGTRSSIHDGLDARSSIAENPGSVVAFFAAQDFETAPEVPRPADADLTPDNAHGLLSFHLQCLLQQPTERMSYRELGRKLVGRYRSERGSRPPTPCFAGDLDQEVLGFEEWPEPNPLIMEVEYERIAAGQLAGLTPGSILSVHPADVLAGNELLGRVRLTDVTATASSFEIVDAKSSIDPFPDRARCRVESQDLGDMRVRLACVSSNDLGSMEMSRQLNAAFAELDDPAREVVQLVERVEDAEWLLTDPGVPASDTVRESTNGKPSLRLTPSRTTSTVQQVEVSYPVESANLLAARLTDDLHKISTWQNLWRIANAYGEGSPTWQKRSVALEVAQLHGPQDHSRGVPPPSNKVQVGDCFVVRVVNHSVAPQWYTVLFLNGQFGIEFVTSGSLAPRGNQEGVRADGGYEREIERISIASDLFGVEGYIVIAVSQRQHRNEPNYRFLAQSALGTASYRNGFDGSRLTTPFEQLLLNAVHAPARSRSGVSPDEPQIDTWSWTPVETGRVRDFASPMPP